MTGLNANTAASQDAGNCLMAWLYCVIVNALCAADRSLINRLYAPMAQQIKTAKKLTQSVVLSIEESVTVIKIRDVIKTPHNRFAIMGRFLIGCLHHT
jgi:hypothetical protein